jgi:protein-S-isoprenylcysteine O-methyltransferase Ste14
MKTPRSEVPGKGGGWVAAQAVLMLAWVFMPVASGQWPFGEAVRWAGATVAALGLVPFAGGMVNLGGNLTPFPRPRKDGRLVTGGLYAIVRHPMYAGGLMLAGGGAVALGSWPKLTVASVLALLFDAKSRREETMLRKQFPEYAEYQQRVRRLIPWVY